MTSEEFREGPDFAASLDHDDPLSGFRSEFVLPKAPDGSDAIYLVGNSLGAMPRRIGEFIGRELDRWGAIGVNGHHEPDHPWTDYHDLVVGPMAELVGGNVDEVVVMNALTVNLHLLLTSFYRPDSSRHEILIEEHAFPSDHFAVESQIRQRGGDVVDSLITVAPPRGSANLRTDDVIRVIEERGERLAVVMLPGIQYYTGQVLDMAAITEAGHGVGAKVGFDLAHAVGNIELDLHGWNVDFAAWCTYKYLNAGPGSIGGAFVHERHLADQTIPKFLGWWGNRKDTRFRMETVHEPLLTAESWQVSNSPILLLAALRASLDIFSRAGGMRPLRRKSELQIRYLDFLLGRRMTGRVESITPTPMTERGSQFALTVADESIDGQRVFERLEAAGVMCDWRYPNVIRVAPTPLYNSFSDIQRFVEILDSVCN